MSNDKLFNFDFCRLGIRLAEELQENILAAHLNADAIMFRFGTWCTMFETSNIVVELKTQEFTPP